LPAEENTKKEVDNLSEENHPNIQAVQLTMDILQSIKKNLRGRAKDPRMSNKVMQKVNEIKCGIGSNDLIEFVANTSTLIDNVVEGIETNVPLEYKTLEEQIMALWKSRGMEVTLTRFKTDEKGNGIWTVKADLKRKEVYLL
jgi:hypothetical protein